ncbi:STAS domain-containing protein [Paractinoplanes atraurantiacus]|uniref:Anti-anti-sigma factor n=1 Tax=Paractinoplanes atraurantiacus TaxID=1036182 RepID=A0A285GPV4_9ACTN|nr:STAS domain-containing protein [Actinoplanes atraurantiacus]SNY25567.1 anti-anti-sigma factor [Actinoplanes atraurantiacus]
MKGKPEGIAVRTGLEAAPGLISLSESGEVAVLRLRGDIDAAMAPVLGDSLAWAVDHHPHVVLDVSATQDMAPAVVDVLARARRRSRSRGTPLQIAAPPERLEALLSRMSGRREQR